MRPSSTNPVLLGRSTAVKTFTRNNDNPVEPRICRQASRIRTFLPADKSPAGMKSRTCLADLLIALAIKDQCRHAALCGSDTPAPNETLGSVAHLASQYKSFRKRFVPAFSIVTCSRSNPQQSLLSHSVPVGVFSSRPLSERASSVRPGGGFLPLGRAVNHKDQCRRAPCYGGSAPAPNETKGSVADEIDDENNSLRRIDDAGV
jgi:hypothetical protein